MSCKSTPSLGFWVCLVFFFAMQLIGSQFPNQGLNLGHGHENPGSQPPGHQGIPNKSTTLRRRQWHPTPVLWPGKTHGWRSLVGYSPWGRQESDTTERLHLHFSLLCIGERNGNPLQCSCLENPRDWGACWAAISGVAQSWTRLKRLSSSSHYFEQHY